MRIDGSFHLSRRTIPVRAHLQQGLRQHTCRAFIVIFPVTTREIRNSGCADSNEIFMMDANCTPWRPFGQPAGKNTTTLPLFREKVEMRRFSRQKTLEAIVGAEAQYAGFQPVAGTGDHVTTACKIDIEVFPFY